MEYNGEDIRKAQMEQRQRILESFGQIDLFSGRGDSNVLMNSMEKAEDNVIEKARQVGDMHPNGKWVWTEYKPGKFDWRGVNPKRVGRTSKTTALSSSEDSKKLIGYVTVSEVKEMIKMMRDFANGVDWTEENKRKAESFLRLIPQDYRSSDKNIINRMNITLKTLKNHYPELLKSNKTDNNSNKKMDSKSSSKTENKKSTAKTNYFKDVKGVGERHSFDLKKSDDKDKNELFDKIKNHFRFINNEQDGEWSNSNVDDYIHKDNDGNYIVSVWNKYGDNNSDVYGELANKKINSDTEIIFNKNGKKWIATERKIRYYGLPDIKRKLNFNFL